MLGVGRLCPRREPVVGDSCPARVGPRLPFVKIRRWAGIVVVIASVGLSACSSGSASTETKALTPVETAMAWFHAINTDNVAAARALFVPSQRQQIAWMDQPRSDLSTFSDLRCATESTSANKAAVRCTFKESASPSEGNPDSFWSVYMQRAPAGSWLINGYGQP
jgi:hypothetical protein